MKISMIESGGWTNIRSGCTVDTAGLPDAVAETLRRALVDAQLFHTHAAPEGARDARTILILVECGDRSRRASFSEAAPPEAARPLLDILRPLCRPMPPAA